VKRVGEVSEREDEEGEGEGEKGERGSVQGRER